MPAYLPVPRLNLLIAALVDHLRAGRLLKCERLRVVLCVTPEAAAGEREGVGAEAGLRVGALALNTP